MAIQVRQWETAQDGLENLRLVNAEVSTELKENEVLVEVHAVALNYRDAEVAQGLYKHHESTSGPAKPLVACSDMCGRVVCTGPSLQYHLSSGDRVASTFIQTHLTGQVTAEDMNHGLGLPLPGVLTTYRVFPSHGLVKVPKYLSDEEVACLPIAAVTAWMSINGMRPMGQPGGEGEVVLCQGTGGVSVSGLQIAKASGATVIITSSSDAKLQKAKLLGADHLINYRTTPAWDEAVNALTSSHGADIILETGGAGTLRKSFNSIAFGGLINCIGYLSGKVDDDEPGGDRTNVNVLALRRNVTLKGILNGPRDRFEEMLEFYKRKQIRPVVDRVFGFEEAKEAFEYLWSGGHFGKIVIKVK